MFLSSMRQWTRRSSDQDGARHYVAIYEIDGPEALRSAEFNQRRGWGEFAGHVKWASRLYHRIAARVGSGGTLGRVLIKGGRPRPCSMSAICANADPLRAVSKVADVPQADIRELPGQPVPAVLGSPVNPNSSK
jgi:hypothetical protein